MKFYIERDLSAASKVGSPISLLVRGFPPSDLLESTDALNRTLVATVRRKCRRSHGNLFRSLRGTHLLFVIKKNTADISMFFVAIPGISIEQGDQQNFMFYV